MEQYQGDLQIVAKRLTVTEAYALKSRLEACRIPAEVGDPGAGTLLGDMVGGVNVRVPADLVTQAKDIIEAFKRGDFALDESFEVDEEATPAASIASETNESNLKSFRVYTKPGLAVPIVVKVGFSWAAFFFGPFWFLLNQMWLGFLALVALIMGGNMYLAKLEPTDRPDPMLGLAVMSAVLATCFLVGKFANVLLSASLESRGFRLQAIVRAKDAAYAREVAAIAAEDGVSSAVQK